MGFMDKVKDIGKKTLKTVLVAASEFNGKVQNEVTYKGYNLKECLVGTDSQDNAIVFIKATQEVTRISLSDVSCFTLRSTKSGESYLTGISVKNEDDEANSINIFVFTYINNNPEKASIPGVYTSTKTSNFKKFINFIVSQGIKTDEETEKEIMILKNM